MDLRPLIEHPELMDKATLYELRELTALHPYYQPARLLLLQNLYLLHDSSFDDELRRAAVYITDRTRLFDLVEARHYRLRPAKHSAASATSGSDRTMSLIDDFLGTSPSSVSQSPTGSPRRKPTATDATIDYMAFLMGEDDSGEGSDKAPEMKGQSLIDKFINEESGKMHLHENPEYAPPTDEQSHKSGDEGYFTATLARIYVKQGRYSKALEIIRRLNLNYPKKSAYFADQIRFLEKLVINSQSK